MGNSLSYNSQTNQLKTGKDAPILNNYINTFFKELPDDLANSDKVLKKRGMSVEDRGKLNELFKRPLKARACCLQQARIPIALPYVYPYKKDGFVGDENKNYGMCNKDSDCKSNKCENKRCKPVAGEKSKDVIKTTFAKVKVFDKSLDESCGGIEGKEGFFRYRNRNIKMFPEVHEVSSDKAFTADSATRRTMCKPFIGTVDFIDKKSSGIGICDRIIETRRLSKPSNELYHFYGDAIYGNQDIGFIDKDNSDNFRKLSGNSNNAYPECSCTNSVFIRTPVTGDNGTKLNQMQTYAAQQNSDKRCRNADGNAFVGEIQKQPISMCVNIAKNIRALADGGSKINLGQTCSAKTDVRKETNVNKMKDMDNEDNIRETEKVEKQEKDKKEANIKMVEKAKERLRQQEIDKTDEQKAAEKKAEMEAAAAEKAKKEAEEKAALEAAKKAAAAEAKKREEERLAKEAAEEAKRLAEEKRLAEIAAAKKKAEMEAAAKTRNMIMIGGGVSLVVIIIVIVLFSSGGGDKKYKKINDEDDDE